MMLAREKSNSSTRSSAKFTTFVDHRKNHSIMGGHKNAILLDHGPFFQSMDQ